MTQTPLSSLNAGSLEPRRNRRRSRRKGVLDHTKHLLAPPLGHRHQSTKLQPRQLDEAGRTNRPEPEVGQKVSREDRLVHLEALVLRLAFAVPISKRFERLRATVPRVADRSEEEGLHHPRARLLHQVRA